MDIEKYVVTVDKNTKEELEEEFIEIVTVDGEGFCNPLVKILSELYLKESEYERSKGEEK